MKYSSRKLFSHCMIWGRSLPRSYTRSTRRINILWGLRCHWHRINKVRSIHMSSWRLCRLIRPALSIKCLGALPCWLRKYRRVNLSGRQEVRYMLRFLHIDTRRMLRKGLSRKSLRMVKGRKFLIPQAKIAKLLGLSKWKLSKLLPPAQKAS